jgi:hypothetical protein
VITLLTIEGLLSMAQRAEHPEHIKNGNFKKAEKEPKSVKPQSAYRNTERSRAWVSPTMCSRAQSSQPECPA